ncbi:hypothetical protein H920_03942 [Fukomys damarensis]|uniref:Uncharacterized protein n=1 Tax=Fukomys damarensis TaxID=885580 RepID=A0A091DR00_FUKDA|nr:hypothetical protein H920_03942 [Fukomys damarensis]
MWTSLPSFTVTTFFHVGGSGTRSLDTYALNLARCTPLSAALPKSVEYECSAVTFSQMHPASSDKMDGLSVPEAVMVWLQGKLAESSHPPRSTWVLAGTTVDGRTSPEWAQPGGEVLALEEGRRQLALAVAIFGPRFIWFSIDMSFSTVF